MLFDKNKQEIRELKESISNFRLELIMLERKYREHESSIVILKKEIKAREFERSKIKYESLSGSILSNPTDEKCERLQTENSELKKQLKDVYFQGREFLGREEQYLHMISKLEETIEKIVERIKQLEEENYKLLERIDELNENNGEFNKDNKELHAENSILKKKLKDVSFSFGELCTLKNINESIFHTIKKFNDSEVIFYGCTKTNILIHLEKFNKMIQDCIRRTPRED